MGLSFNGNGQFQPIRQPQKIVKQQQQPAAENKHGILYRADDSGCSYYRMANPALLMNYRNMARLDLSSRVTTEPKHYMRSSSIVLQRQMSAGQVKYVEFLRRVATACKDQLNRELLIKYEIDDICLKKDIPLYNACRNKYKDESLGDNFKKIVNLCDEMIVASPFMKQYYKEELGYDNIITVPDYCPKSWIDRYYNLGDRLELFEKHKKKPRVLWACSATHFDIAKSGEPDDFSIIWPIIQKTLDKYQWVIFGALHPKMQHLVKQGKIEYHPWVHIPEYPQKLHELNAQFTIAPLISNNFNRAKAFIKYTESCHMGIPFIGQNLEPYEKAFHLFDKSDEMVDLIDNCCKSYDLEVVKHRTAGDKYWLDDHLDEYFLAWFTKPGDPRRNKNQTFKDLNT